MESNAGVETRPLASKHWNTRRTVRVRYTTLIAFALCGRLIVDSAFIAVKTWVRKQLSVAKKCAFHRLRSSTARSNPRSLFDANRHVSMTNWRLSIPRKRRGILQFTRYYKKRVLAISVKSTGSPWLLAHTGLIHTVFVPASRPVEIASERTAPTAGLADFFLSLRYSAVDDVIRRTIVQIDPTFAGGEELQIEFGLCIGIFAMRSCHSRCVSSHLRFCRKPIRYFVPITRCIHFVLRILRLKLKTSEVETCSYIF